MPCSTETQSPSNPRMQDLPVDGGDRHLPPAIRTPGFRTRPQARTRPRGSEVREARVLARRCAAGRPRRSWRASSHERADVRDPIDQRSRRRYPCGVSVQLCVKVAERSERARYVHPVSTLRESPVGSSPPGKHLRSSGSGWRERSATRRSIAPPLLAPAIALVAGVVTGCLVLFMHESGSALRVGGDLGGPWLLAAFAAGSISKNRTLAAVTGFATLLAMLLGYYWIGNLDGSAEIAHTFRFWLAVSLVAGPVMGWAGWSWLGATALERVAGYLHPRGLLDRGGDLLLVVRPPHRAGGGGGDRRRRRVPLTSIWARTRPDRARDRGRHRVRVRDLRDASSHLHRAVLAGGLEPAGTASQTASAARWRSMARRSISFRPPQIP